MFTQVLFLYPVPAAAPSHWETRVVLSCTGALGLSLSRNVNPVFRAYHCQISLFRKYVLELMLPFVEVQIHLTRVFCVSIPMTYFDNQSSNPLIQSLVCLLTKFNKFVPGTSNSSHGLIFFLHLPLDRGLWLRPTTKAKQEVSVKLASHF